MLGWTKVTRIVRAAGGSRRSWRKPKLKMTATTSSGNSISPIHAERASGVSSNLTEAEKNDSETQTTRNEIPQTPSLTRAG